MVKRYLEYNDHDWSLNTRTRYRYLLNNYINSGFPENPSTKAMTIRVLNGCNNWGFKNGLTDKKEKLNGGSNWENRSRVYNDLELNLLFNELRDQDFNSFVKFAYFTGARSGEIRRLKPENIADGYLDITGKTGRRMVKITTQAANVLSNQDPLWSYSRDFVSHKFKKECRRLGIKNARFHDLRRTFGYNLIKQGMSIYKVSKLLGHSSVRTTEQHYAPLMTTEIEDFVL
ncbi:MAG TPA: site-specific integrase [Candidatus Marinimicrobia bacterium]|nr:site-specific integrase [Candidatus Neomarinimicrobiota bacterium]